TCRAEVPSGSRVCPRDGTRLPGAADSIATLDGGSTLPGSLPGTATTLGGASASSPAPVTAAAARAATELAPGVEVGEYRVVGTLGEGGMGTVYAAVHPLIGKKAAIKVIRPELGTSTDAIERFVQEARAVNQIGHPNIVDVF